MTDFILFPLRLIGTVIGLLAQFGIGGTVRRIRNGSVKFSSQGLAFYRASIDTSAPKAQD